MYPRNSWVGREPSHDMGLHFFSLRSGRLWGEEVQSAGFVRPITLSSHIFSLKLGFVFFPGVTGMTVTKGVRALKANLKKNGFKKIGPFLDMLISRNSLKISWNRKKS